MRTHRRRSVLKAFCGHLSPAQAEMNCLIECTEATETTKKEEGWVSMGAMGMLTLLYYQ